MPTLAILVAALAVVSALVFQAFRAEQDQRATASRALREYAGFAAWEFASNMKEEMWLAMTELLRPAEQLDPPQPGADLPSPGILVAQARHIEHCNDCSASIPASYYFRLDLNDSALTTVLSDGTVAREPERLERSWIRDTITRHSIHVFKTNWRVATVVGEVDGRRLTVSYTVVRDTTGRPVAAFGVVSESKPYVAAFAANVTKWELLPPSLAKQANDEHLVAITVRDEKNNVLYRSPWQFGDQYSAEYEQTKNMTGFTVEASLKPGVAGRLILGDSYRFPVLIALLVITAALVAIAFRQLQREAALARLRADFVSSVSHELRTPLAQIRMFAELLRMGWIRSTQEHTRSLDIIDQEARRLGHLVDKVLCFDRVERGENTLMTEQTELALLVREVLEAFAPLASARHMQVSVNLDDVVIAEVDRGAMRQVLINLLDNAVKYGPSGQTISVGLDRATDGRSARIWVEDEGPGIPESERQQIWEPFHRLDRDANSAVAGSGIGLALVRNLTIAHGGQVFVEEGAGGGSRFTVEIPCTAQPYSPMPVGIAGSNGVGSYGVEDQLVTRR
ncbi:MAG TPA: HAMP domain-containing sensor histidine kinase [Gemmatimonadaceae bacterium]|nr:HAMP domain-containing sensor histidine kinase [Gemmatimonadaceae bacterium]